MPLDWGEYDRFGWANASRLPLDDGERAIVAAFAADVLDLAASDRAGAWGAASAPGRFAATVVRVNPDVAHRYTVPARAAGVEAIGVKVFKVTADAAREARRAETFHRDELTHLPGLPNPRVQRSLGAGVRSDGAGRARGFVVQEWADGETLENLFRRGVVTGAVARGVLAQLLGEVVIPLWAAGTVWWDFRDANVCIHPAAGIRLIDVDSLGAYAGEILQTPHVWDKRDKGRVTALARLRRMAVRLAQAGSPAARARTEREVTAAWAAELEGPLTALGKSADAATRATEALKRFIARLEARGVLPAAEAELTTRRTDE